MTEKKMITLLKDLWKDRFKRYLIISLLIVGILVLAREYSAGQAVTSDGPVVHFFFHPECPHCNQQKPFNEVLKQKYPGIVWIYHDVSKPKEAALMSQFAAERDIPAAQLGVPATFFGDTQFIGFHTAETTGKDIESALSDFAEGKATTGSPEKKIVEEVEIPFIGKINVMEYSLPVLAIILGLVDGFNPCAMWVLVYLISLVVMLKDRRKIWLLVGSFVFASGMLYFLFMTAWLNVFLFIGYLRPLTLGIGLFALGIGISNIHEYIKTKGAIVCKVSSGKSKMKIMERIEKVVHSPLTLATVGGIILLAFVVNAIEFACSSAIPAVFTQVLALSDLSGWAYYGYILLYDLFFMLDDLIIFGLAAFAATTTLGDKYAKHCKLIGGIVILVLGLILTFAPQLLG